MGYLGQLPKFNINDDDLRLASRQRDELSNKYSNGRILIIGGSSSYYGAPVLALDSAYQSLAALRVGSGYVKAYVPKSILQSARSLSPNTIIEPLGDKSILFNQEIKEEVEKADVILLGMGLGAKSRLLQRR
jgi:ADP-dependent NAD(P)H-hydrate dehydratase / NAD(P)H-hydrate epimerase